MSMKDPNSAHRPFQDVSETHNVRHRSWSGRLLRVLLTAATGFLIWSWAVDDGTSFHHPDGSIDTPDEDDFARPNPINSFRDVEPSKALKWVPCYRSEGPFLCSRLVVPMDYHRPLEDCPNHPTVELALLLRPGEGRGGYGEDVNVIPANFSTSPLLVNPGGPGGPGTYLVRVYGARLQSIIGNDRDILGFDPRGVGDSTPRADCFLQSTTPAPGGEPVPASSQDAFMRRLMFEAGAAGIGVVNSSDVALAKIDARSRAVNQLCDAKDEEEGDRNILRYAGTPNVARDMLSIVHAWDEWQGVDTTSKVEVEEETTGEANGKDHDKALDTRGKLVYWGFSYGTLLGATFSAMFPERVGRVIIDGVCDADHYVSPTWYDSLMDADIIWDKFFTYCHEAEDKCAFWHPSYSVEDLKARYQAIEDDVKANPIIVVTADKLPVLVTYSDLKNLMFHFLYSPMMGFPLAAYILVGLENRLPMALSAALPEENGCLTEPATYPNDATRAVMCGDKRYPLNDTLPELQEQFERMASYSPNFGNVWMTLMLMCSHYDIPISDPPMRWGKNPPKNVGHDSSSSFGGGEKPSVKLIPREQGEEDTVLSLMSAEKKIKTSFPLLVMTNTYDPVTPKAAAIKMTKKFEGARLLEQEAIGHCTLAATSLCTLMNVRKYIRDGTLPEEPIFSDGKWTVCETDDRPWFPAGHDRVPVAAEGTAAAAAAAEVSEMQSRMVESWAGLQKMMTEDNNIPRYGQTKLSQGSEILLKMLDP
ncbi:hypothetical protein MKZ38_007037 [Zalerion maritima]|uniref:Peptidase S33 tripeptidyl aminopeptidase-like C-terminal domain-containing protein n=1 Tax=Zalerion maritima TaxID=339359 RepID=A0AAD5WVM8_9PEZI|nr:hypothetical protein MKZ38_007037 [Zalerion maritima]